MDGTTWASQHVEPRLDVKEGLTCVERSGSWMTMSMLRCGHGCRRSRGRTSEPNVAEPTLDA